MGSKKPDAKAIVSFSSDSDEEDSSSSSSRLSSSASSGEDSEVETFSVAFPAPGKTAIQGVAVGGGGGGSGEAAAKAESKTRPETKKTEPVKAISPEPRKSPVADKSAVKRTNAPEEAASKKDPITTKDKLVTSDSVKEVRKSSGKQEETSGTLDVTKKGGSSVPSERAKSPKITINDVDEEDTAKQTKKSPGNDVTVTSNKLTSKTPATSPKKTSNDGVEAELPSLSLKSRKDGVRAVSPKKEDTAEDVSEVAKTPKRSPKLTAEKEKSPKDTEEEPDVKSVDRAKSPKKAAVDKDAERAKSPKKTLDVQDSERAKSPKETDAERAKSPKKTAEDGGETKKKSNKDSSKTPYELLRSVDSPEKSPTRSTKPKKSLTTTEDDSTTTSKRKSPLKDLEGKEQEDAVETAKPKKASKKTAKTILSDEAEVSDNVANSRKDEDATRSGKVKNEPSADGDQSQKTGVSEAKVKDQSDTASEVEQLLKEIRQKRINNQLESETPEVDGGVDKLIRVTVDDATGKTDDSSKSPREAEVKDKDYTKVTGTSRKSPADETTTGSKPELENEESEFTYRRKSMDDFIKRILAEAKEERLKQKHGGAASNETSTTATEGDEKKAGVDRYAERNGGITENGLDGVTKWNGGGSGSGSAEDKEGSKMLDRRLAKIEKRRFGDSASDAGKGEGGGGGVVEGSRSKVVGKETEEKPGKDKADYDVNLDEDLEEINRFLQSRKTAAASRFNFDDQQLNDDDPSTTTPTTATPTKRRWATNKDPQQLPGEEDDLQPRSQIKKKYSSNVDVDLDDDDERFLGRFKRDSVAVPEESFSPRRRDETDEIIRERTRNVRVLVDQQVEIVQAMRTTSKSLDDLEKEIREVRQVCMNRQARIEALEGELGAEYRAFENDQVAATDRQKDGSLMGSREDFGGLAGMGRLRRQDKFKSESLDEENFPFRRRSGSVASTTSYTSGFESSRGRPGEDVGLDSRPPSGLKQSRRTSEGESDLSSGLDRRRGGSAARDRISDVTPFGPDDLSNSFLSQRSARSRASIATSTPAVDYAGTISGDSFLAKIRAKYSFLNPALDSQSYSSPSSIRGSSGISSSSSYTTPSSLTYGKRLGSRDILSSPSAYSSYSTGGYGVSPSFTTTGGISGGRYSSIRDSRSPSYGSGGFIGSSSITGGISSSYGDSGGRMRRAQSVSEMSFDRPSASSPTNLGSSSGGEFHSRFLDKVRGKKAMGDDFGTSSVPSASSVSSSSSQSKGGEKPFKSRFLKTTSSFDAGSSRSDRLTNGFEDGNDVGGYGRGGGTSEVNGDA